MSKRDLIKTGIEGLDAVFLGGIPRSNVILLQGVTGSGKTLMGLEFIYRGIVQYDEPGLIVVFETNPDKLTRDAAEFGWDLEDLQRRKKLQIIFTSPQVFEQELRSPDSLLLETASDIGAQRIFVDGIGLLNPNMGIANSPNGGYRESLQRLFESLQRESLTAIFSLEVGRGPDSISTVEMTDFIADTVIQLGRERCGRRMKRCIEILKSRGQDYDAGEHTLRITGGQGLEVFRRVQAPRHTLSMQPTSSTMRSVIGVEVIDTLIGGGIFDGSTTMVVGVSGVGKTVLGTQNPAGRIIKAKNAGITRLLG
jgi:circadian clock protein KaiC